MNNRKPVYVDNRNRVISIANGLWQVQCHSGTAGTRAHDPWQNVSGPYATRLEAVNAIGNPLREGE